MKAPENTVEVDGVWYGPNMVRDMKADLRRHKALYAELRELAVRLLAELDNVWGPAGGVPDNVEKLRADARRLGVLR